VARSKIRLCQFTPCLWSGGTEERIARILGALDRDEFDLTWMGFGPVREALIDRAGPGITVLPIARDVASGIEPRLIASLARQLAGLAPDVMHIHNWSTSLYGIAAARLAGVPTIVYGLGGQDSTASPPRRRVAAMRTLAPHVDRFTAVCEYLGREVGLHWDVPAERISVLRTGIDLTDIDAAPAKAAVRAELGLPPNAKVVGAISVFRPVKRIPDLIDAAGLLAESHPDLHVLLVGNSVGVSTEELRTQAADRGLAGRFHLLGRVERPAWTLPAFDVFVNCSLFEGASNAIIEAMAARIPIVATGVGGTPELIEDGREGLLVGPADVPGLARALDRLLVDPALRTRLGDAGRARVERDHTHEAMNRSYLEFYRDCARRGGPRGLGRAARTARDVMASLGRVTRQA
jgi:glycosyltransferase involved in cell wall biosynthesis